MGLEFSVWSTLLVHRRPVVLAEDWGAGYTFVDYKTLTPRKRVHLLRAVCLVLASVLARLPSLWLNEPQLNENKTNRLVFLDTRPACPTNWSTSTSILSSWLTSINHITTMASWTDAIYERSLFLALGARDELASPTTTYADVLRLSETLSRELCSWDWRLLIRTFYHALWQPKRFGHDVVRHRKQHTACSSEIKLV